eukprot:751347-Hanusia_phi.AAC.5
MFDACIHSSQHKTFEPLSGVSSKVVENYASEIIATQRSRHKRHVITRQKSKPPPSEEEVRLSPVDWSQVKIFENQQVAKAKVDDPATSKRQFQSARASFRRVPSSKDMQATAMHAKIGHLTCDSPLHGLKLHL